MSEGRRVVCVLGIELRVRRLLVLLSCRGCYVESYQEVCVELEEHEVHEVQRWYGCEANKPRARQSHQHGDLCALFDPVLPMLCLFVKARASHFVEVRRSCNRGLGRGTTRSS